MTTTYFPSVDDLVERVRGEYIEMPGLRLTLAQARRLWAIDEATCGQVLQRLADVNFLARSSDGKYTRLSAG